MAYVPLVQLRLESRTTGKNPESLGLNFFGNSEFFLSSFLNVYILYTSSSSFLNSDFYFIVETIHFFPKDAIRVQNR